MKSTIVIFFYLLAWGYSFAQISQDELQDNMCNLYRLSDSKTRSISAENRTGEKGKGGMATLKNGSAVNAAKNLGQGWKVNPYLIVSANETISLANIEGMGAIKHIWITQNGKNRTNWRNVIIRFYWDDESTPSVEVPLGDFFGIGWEKSHQITSLPVCVNPLQAFNCYWTMPFRKKCRITLENRINNPISIYYQIDYELCKIPKNAAYFHAQFRRINPTLGTSDYVIIDNIKGKGQYVGTTMAYRTNEERWWGEGEIKFFIDGDSKFPTIVGTGTEDYFCGSHDFEVRNDSNKRVYKNFSTPYSGFHVISNSEVNIPGTKFDLYRWHINDPIRFEKNLKVTIQNLGWNQDRTYKQLKEDVSTVAFWYQSEPHSIMPPLPSKELLNTGINN